MSWADPTSGETTVDARIHLYEWFTASEELSELLTAKTDCISNLTAANGMKMWDWCDCVCAILEVTTLSAGVAGLRVIASVPSPAAVSRVLINLLGSVPTGKKSRAMLAKAAHAAMPTYTDAQKAANVLHPADMITRNYPYCPLWQWGITYEMEAEIGAGTVLKVLYFFDAPCMRDGARGSAALDLVRKTMEQYNRIEPNTAGDHPTIQGLISNVRAVLELLG